MKFDLRYEPWITVKDLQGNNIDVSLQDALIRAHEYQSIESSSPLQMMALHRVLLAVLYRAFPEYTSHAQQGAYSQLEKGQGLDEAAITDYLAQFPDAFDLFHAEKPFWQLPHLNQEQLIKPCAFLAAETSGANTTAVFNESNRKYAEQQFPAFTPAQAARMLVERQTFVLGGIVGHFITSAPAAPSAPSIFVLVQGPTLAHTLLLNWVLPADGYDQDDAPIWERMQHQPLKEAYVRSDPTEKIHGLAQRYTWFSRSVRLIPDEDGLVRKMMFASGIRGSVEGLDIEVYRDPMLSYAQNKEKKFFAKSFSEDQAFWRNFESILKLHSQEEEKTSLAPKVIEHAATLMECAKTKRVGVLIAGQVSDQAKIKTLRLERYPLPLLSSDSEYAQTVYELVKNATESARSVGHSLRWSAQVLAEALLSQSLKRKIDKKDITLFTKSLPTESSYWQALETKFGAWLQGISSVDDLELLGAWRKVCVQQAQASLELTKQMVGERAIALRALNAAERAFYGDLSKHAPQIAAIVKPAKQIPQPEATAEQ